MGSLAMRNPLKGFEKRIERQVPRAARDPKSSDPRPPALHNPSGGGNNAAFRPTGRSAYLRTTPTWYIRFPVARVKAAHW